LGLCYSIRGDTGSIYLVFPGLTRDPFFPV
jgi:hypothetical protein